MSEEKENTEAFNNLRGSFDDLQMDEQARFLVEAALSMVATGAREAGNVVSKVVDDIVTNINCDDEEGGAEDSAEAEAAPAEEPKPKAKAKPKRRTTRKKPAAKDGDA